MAAVSVKVEPENDPDPDDSWLYGSDGVKKIQDPQVSSMDSVPADSRLSADAAVFEPRKLAEMPEVPTDRNIENIENQAGGEDSLDGENGDDDEDSEDDVQVTIGQIKAQAYDPAAKFKSPYQRQPSQGAVGAGVVPGVGPVVGPGVGSGVATTTGKPPSKGVDLEAVGSINGVPVYEFDIDALKIEDKPWRKPGADITDYFNYGFTEDTWTKYCERQRRLRMEINSNKTGGNIIFVQGGNVPSHPDQSHLIDSIKQEPGYVGTGPLHRPPGMMSGPRKTSGIIDVIGGTSRDSRRPQPQDFMDQGGDESQDYQQISSVSSVMPMSMSMPPPMLNMPPPDFGMPPPPGSMPPGHGGPMAPPPMGPPPPGLLPHHPLIVGPPPGFPPPTMGGPQFDPFFRPPMVGGPPPPQHDRRPIPGYPDRPPFRFDGPYGAPPPFPPQSGNVPPSWDNRPFDSYPIERPGNNGDRPPPNWDFRGGSPKSDSDISSSGDERNKTRVREFVEPIDREMRQERIERVERARERSRSRDRSRIREADRDRDRVRDFEKERSRDRERSRERERERSRDRDRSRDRSRERVRERDRSRERTSVRGERERSDRGRDSGHDRERKHHPREHEDRRHHSSKRRERDSRDEEPEDRQHSSSRKHKKTSSSSKIKEEPIDDASAAPAPSGDDGAKS